MLDITQIFSSKAKTKALRTLYYQQAPLPLRQVAYLSEIPLFSIQRVLKQMAKEKMVIQKKKKNYRLFSLNKNHSHYYFLTQLFNLEMKSQIPFLSSRFHKKAKSLLDFVNTAQNFFKNVKAT